MRTTLKVDFHRERSGHKKYFSTIGKTPVQIREMTTAPGLHAGKTLGSGREPSQVKRTWPISGVQLLIKCCHEKIELLMWKSFHVKI